MVGCHVKYRMCINDQLYSYMSTVMCSAYNVMHAILFLFVYQNDVYLIVLNIRTIR